MKNVIYTAMAIAFCLGVGKLLNHYLSGLPAGLYGMILYCFLLQTNLLNPEKISQANLWIIRNMGICFVPSAVGVINHFDLIKQHGFTIVITIVLTTFILLTFVAVVAERYLAPQSKQNI